MQRFRLTASCNPARQNASKHCPKSRILIEVACSVHPKLKRDICQCKNSTVCTRGNAMLTQRSCNSSQELCTDPLRLPSESHRQKSSSSAQWLAQLSIAHDQARAAHELLGSGPLQVPSESHRQKSLSSAQWHARLSVSHDQARGAQEFAGAVRSNTIPTKDRR